jgi:hypothetical protein
MSTTQSLLNKVLIGLRQTQITTTSTTDAYELLLLQYVNEAKEEVEEAWDWEALRATVTVTGVASTSTYTVTAAGDADVTTTERSKLLYEAAADNGGRESSSRTFGDLPQVFDVTDASESRLIEVTPEKMERLHFTDDDLEQDPKYFTLYSDGTSLIFKVFPTPADARTFKLRIYNPQAELASTSLDSTTLTVPTRPVWTKALYKANEERGEEIARPNGPNHMAAQDALSVAIAREQTVADYTGTPE